MSILHTYIPSRVIDDNGLADGATLTFYLSGTNTLTPVYADAALTTPLTNPVVVPSGAEVPTIYLDDAIDYRRVVTYSDGSTEDVDPYEEPFGQEARQVRADLASTDSGKGAELVGLSEGGTVEAAINFLTPERFAGADDMARIEAMFVQSGITGNKNFQFSSRTYEIEEGLTFPDGAKVRANGTTFEIGASGSVAAINVGSNNDIDTLRLSLPAGVVQRGVYAVGKAAIKIGRIEVIATDQQGPSPSDLQAVVFENCDGVEVGFIDTENYDRPVRLTDCTQVRIGGGSLTGYIRGLYIESCNGVKVGRTFITGKSPSASYSPGHNAVLIQSANSDCQNITLKDFVVEDSGEHGMRVGGGAFNSLNVFFVRPAFRRTGASAIKVQGEADNAPSPKYSKNVKIIEPIIEDCGPADYSGISLSMDNYSAVICKYVDGLTITSPVIRKKDQAFSCKGGIYLQAILDWTITNPVIRDAKFDGIFISLNATATVDVQDGLISGGQLMFNGRHGLAIEYPSSTLRRFFVEGTKCTNNTGYGIAIQQNTFAGVTGSGTVNTAIISAITEGNTAGAVSCDNSTIVLAMKGQYGATTARNGSTWHDRVGGAFKVLKAGTWTNI